MMGVFLLWFEDVPLVEFTCLVFTRDIFPVLNNPPVSVDFFKFLLVAVVLFIDFSFSFS